MKWSEHQTMNFVLEYIKYECLYNVNSIEYKNKQIRDAALLKISQTLAITDFGPKEVYLKIRSLKSTYSQELKKMKCSQRSGAGTSDIYKPNVKWFNILHDTLSGVNSTGEGRETTSNFETHTNSEVEQVDNNLENEERAVGADPEAASQTNSNSSVVKKGNISKNARKRVIKEYDNLLTKVQNVANTVNKPLQSENEFDIFGKSIAAQLKNMPLDMAIEAQMFIQNYLSEMRLKTIQHTMCSGQRSNSSYSNMSQSLISQTLTPSPRTPTPTSPMYHPETSTEVISSDAITLTYENPKSTANTTATLDLLSQAWYSAHDQN